MNTKTPQHKSHILALTFYLRPESRLVCVIEYMCVCFIFDVYVCMREWSFIGFNSSPSGLLLFQRWFYLCLFDCRCFVFPIKYQIAQQPSSSSGRHRSSGSERSFKGEERRAGMVVSIIPSHQTIPIRHIHIQTLPIPIDLNINTPTKHVI